MFRRKPLLLAVGAFGVGYCGWYAYRRWYQNQDSVLANALSPEEFRSFQVTFTHHITTFCLLTVAIHQKLQPQLQYF